MKKPWIIIAAIFSVLLLYLLLKLLFLPNYSAGNVTSFVCVTTEKDYSQHIFEQYIDTFLIKNTEFQNPTDYDIRNQYPHLQMAGFYFKDEPEEMYEVSVSSISFSCVRHLIKMRNRGKLYAVEKPTKEDMERMETRLKGVWNEVEKLIEESNLPNSVKYN